VAARLNRSLEANTSRVGELFTASVTSPLLGSKGQILVPRGATVFGHVGQIDASSDGSGPIVRLAFDSLMFFGRRYAFDASVAGADSSARLAEGTVLTLRATRPLTLP